MALDAAFTNLIADASANEPSLVFKDLPDCEFFVRARAIDSLGLEGRDAVRSLRVAARPFAPALQLPLDNTHVDSGAVRFVWKPEAEAVGYRIQIAERDDFAKPVTDKAALLLPIYFVESPLPSGKCVWRVASVNAKGSVGPWWSDAQRVEVRATAPLLKPKHGQKKVILLLDAAD